jgi:uncharacterized membrane protein
MFAPDRERAHARARARAGVPCKGSRYAAAHHAMGGHQIAEAPQSRDGIPRPAALADRFTRVIGSWWFLAAQTVLIVIWITVNVVAWASRFDPYPFILLNLVFSVWSAYAAPIIMMSQNRQDERDRERAERDLATNVDSHREIEDLQHCLERLERDKVDRILAILEERG